MHATTAEASRHFYCPRGVAVLLTRGFSLNTNMNAPLNKSTGPVRAVLLVDSNDASRLTTKWLLGNFQFEVQSAYSGEDALALFDTNVHELIITDNFLAGMSGLELAHVIKMRSPQTPVIMYSSEPPPDLACLDKVMQKPDDLLFLHEIARKLIGFRAPANMPQ